MTASNHPYTPEIEDGAANDNKKTKSAFKPLPSQDRLHELLDIDHETGTITLKQKHGRRPAGHVEKTEGAKGKVITIDGEQYLQSRVLQMHATGIDPKDNWIDHIDGDTSNNSRANLRLVTPQQNAQNRAMKLNEDGSPLGSWQGADNRWYGYAPVGADTPTDLAVMKHALIRAAFGGFARSNKPRADRPASVSRGRHVKVAATTDTVSKKVKRE